MKAILTVSKPIISTFLFDTIAILFVFLIPSLSHFLSIPLYLIEPMRIALIFAIAFTNRKNALFIAFFLPVTSYLLSSHPLYYKVLLISGELMFNVWFFYFLLNRTRMPFFSAIASIFTSKLFYYLIKFLLTFFIIKDVALIGTPIYIQLIVSLLLSIIVAICFHMKRAG